MEAISPKARTADCYKKPFHVVANGNQFLSGHDEEDDAEANAKRRNLAAEDLDIEERYQVAAGGA